MRFAKSSTNKKLQFLITIGLSLIVLFILGYLVYRQRDVLIHYEWEIRIDRLVYSFLIFSVNLTIVAWTWGQILNRLGFHQNFRVHFRNFNIANFTKRLPGTFWYIVGRATLYKKIGVPKRLTTVASAIEIIIATLSSALISVTFAIGSLSSIQISPTLIIFFVVIGILLIHPRIVHKVLAKLNITANILDYRHLVLWLSLYLIAWILNGALLFSIGNTFTEINIEHFLYIIGCVSLVNLFSTIMFFAPSNFGITELGLSFLLSAIMPTPIAVVLALLSRILITLYELLWALIGILVWPFKDETDLTQMDY